MFRPHLEYTIQGWNPYQKGDIDIIERAHRRATKITKSIWTKSYSERLKILGLKTLEDIRTRYDLIKMYKITKGFDKVEFEEEIEFRNIRRRHDLSFNREAFRSTDRNNFAHFMLIYDTTFLTKRVFPI